ncbi:hypothetical protein ACFVYE_25030 [Streptomyces sp. NPDC058239]
MYVVVLLPMGRFCCVCEPDIQAVPTSGGISQAIAGAGRARATR